MRHIKGVAHGEKLTYQLILQIASARWSVLASFSSVFWLSGFLVVRCQHLCKKVTHKCDKQMKDILNIINIQGRVHSDSLTKARKAV